ncbi:MAG TPA: hypothetical protein VEY07_08305 [Thermoplasmata archaeon]|nr:hypothetical protein [Thermoplasmata archaeon]
MHGVLSEGRLSAEENLTRDERLLAAGVPAGRVATLEGPVLTLGVAQPPATPAATRARSLGIPVVPRRSGGTGLLHQPGDIVWSVILPRRDPRVGRNYARSFDRLGVGAVDSLAGVGIVAQWSPALGLSPEYCLLAPRGQVLTVDGRAIGGAAQHVTARALLHHGTINVRVDRAGLAALFDLDFETAEKSVTSVTELRPTVDLERLATELARHLGEWLVG